MRGSLTPAERTINGTISSNKQLTGELNRAFSVADYNLLSNKPAIEGVTLIGNRTFIELGLISLTNFEIEDMLK